MPLDPGTTLGPYAVTAKIGEGGMGEVYRARDTTLDRDVALKVLPEAFTSDPDRLARFEREAKVLASLNHPNIGHIYGLEEAEGTKALVLELIEGPTLEDRIKRGPIPVDEALPIAKQIAEALEAAHEAGVIHRDLKPANIKVREDGTVKVLDFGLAKALNTSVEGDPNQSPTLTAAATQMGVIMGTAAYMSPEQARGKPVDKRADVWALGCVLFEMLVAARAFKGDSASETLAAVIKTDPSWGSLPADTPPHLHTVLRRCLEKDPRQRVQATGDVRLALDGRFENAVPVANASETPPLRLWSRPVSLLIAATAAVTGGFLAGRVVTPEPPSEAQLVTRTSVVLPGAIEYERIGGGTHGLAVSPDGTQLVFRGGTGDLVPGQLFRRSLDDLTVEPLPGTEAGLQPFFSPDGASVAFFTFGFELKRVGLDGQSPPVTLVEGTSSSGSTGVWREDGIVYSVPEVGIFRVAPDGGTPVELLDAKTGGGYISRLALVPETGDLLYSVGVPGESQRIVGMAPGSRQPVPLVDDALLVTLTVSGHLLFERDGVMLAAAFDPAARTLGPATPVLDRLAYDDGARVPQVAVSPSGTLAYVPAPGSERVATLAWVDADGTRASMGELPAGSEVVDLSPDGTLALVGTTVSPNRMILWDLTRQAPAGLEVEGRTPRWHPDGRRVALGRGTDLLLLDVEDRSEETLVAGTARTDSPSFGVDGATLAYVSFGKAGDQDIFALLPGEAEPRPVVATDAEEHSPSLSPDGRWLAYVSDASSIDFAGDVYVARFPSGTGRRRVTNNGGIEPLWRQDGRVLFFKERRAPTSEEPVWDLRMVSIGPGNTLELGAAESLFATVDATQRVYTGAYWNMGATYQATADGTRFLMVWNTFPEPAKEIVVVQNWHEELKRLVPIRP